MRACMLPTVPIGVSPFCDGGWWRDVIHKPLEKARQSGGHHHHQQQQQQQHHQHQQHAQQHAQQPLQQLHRSGKQPNATVDRVPQPATDVMAFGAATTAASGESARSCCRLEPEVVALAAYKTDQVNACKSVYHINNRMLYHP